SSRWHVSQIVYPLGRRIQHPRTGAWSSSSAAATTSWYHWAKSVARGVIGPSAACPCCSVIVPLGRIPGPSAGAAPRAASRGGGAPGVTGRGGGGAPRGAGGPGRRGGGARAARTGAT